MTQSTYICLFIRLYKDEIIGNKKQSERIALIEKEIINPRNQAVRIILQNKNGWILQPSIAFILSLLYRLLLFIYRLFVELLIKQKKHLASEISNFSMQKTLDMLVCYYYFNCNL